MLGFSTRSAISNTSPVPFGFAMPYRFDFFACHLLEGNHGVGLPIVKAADHPLDHIALRMHPDDRVAQRHHERLAADKRLGTEDGMSETQQPTLPCIEVLNRRPFVIEILEQVLPAGFPQGLNQLDVQVKVILDRGLPGPVTNSRRLIPTRVSSSTTYCTTGLRPTGSISLGWDFVAGSSRVPRPATGTTAMSMSMRDVILEPFSAGSPC